MKIYDSKFPRPNPEGYGGRWQQSIWDSIPNLTRPPRRTAYRGPKPYEPGSRIEWQHACHGKRFHVFTLDKASGGQVWSEAPDGALWVIEDGQPSGVLTLVFPPTGKFPARAWKRADLLGEWIGSE